MTKHNECLNLFREFRNYITDKYKDLYVKKNKGNNKENKKTDWQLIYYSSLLQHTDWDNNYN